MVFPGKMEPPACLDPRVSRQQSASREKQDCPGLRDYMGHRETRAFRALQEWGNQASQERRASKASQDDPVYLGHQVGKVNQENP